MTHYILSTIVFTRMILRKVCWLNLSRARKSYLARSKPTFGLLAFLCAILTNQERHYSQRQASMKSNWDGQGCLWPSFFAKKYYLQFYHESKRTLKARVVNDDLVK